MERSEKVRIETIDGYCGERGIERIDLLKLDVEGHELDVLNGGVEMFRKSAIGMVTCYRE
jgi:FkbM family methyltransferase